MIRRRVDFVINDDKFKDADGNVFQKVGSLYHEGQELNKIQPLINAIKNDSELRKVIENYYASITGISNSYLSKKKPMVQIL